MAFVPSDDEEQDNDEVDEQNVRILNDNNITLVVEPMDENDDVSKILFRNTMCLLPGAFSLPQYKSLLLSYLQIICKYSYTRRHKQ